MGQHSALIQWLEDYAQRRGIRFLNLTQTMAMLSKSKRDACFQRDGHYSKYGNHVVAKALLEDFRELLPNVSR